jgi:hypothetical protein
MRSEGNRSTAYVMQSLNAGVKLQPCKEEIAHGLDLGMAIAKSPPLCIIQPGIICTA